MIRRTTGPNKVSVCQKRSSQRCVQTHCPIVPVTTARHTNNLIDMHTQYLKLTKSGLCLCEGNHTHYKHAVNTKWKHTWRRQRKRENNKAQVVHKHRTRKGLGVPTTWGPHYHTTGHSSQNWKYTNLYARDKKQCYWKYLPGDIGKSHFNGHHHHLVDVLIL